MERDDEAHKVEDDERAGYRDHCPRAGPYDPEPVDLAQRSEEFRGKSVCPYEYNLRPQCGKTVHGFAKKGGVCALVGEPDQLVERVRAHHQISIVREPYGVSTMLI
jgi:hypothetical protein